MYLLPACTTRPRELHMPCRSTDTTRTPFSNLANCGAGLSPLMRFTPPYLWVQWCMRFLHEPSSNAPRCGSGPKCRLEGPPLSPPCAAFPRPARDAPDGALQKGQGGGGRGREGGGRGCGWREGVLLQLLGPAKGSWAQTHLWGLSTSQGRGQGYPGVWVPVVPGISCPKTLSFGFSGAFLNLWFAKSMVSMRVAFP